MAVWRRGDVWIWRGPASAHGFVSVWFAENPFNWSVLPAAAACAVVTERLRIGIGVFNPFSPGVSCKHHKGDMGGHKK